MTRRAPRATLNAIVVALVTLVLAGAVLAAPGSAAAIRSIQPARKHAAKRHVENRVSRGLRAVQIANHLTGIPVPLGRLLAAGRLRLLRARPVRVRQGRDPPSALRRRAVRARDAASREARCAPATSSSSPVSATSASTPAAGSSSTRPGAARPSAGRGSRRTGATTAPRASSQPRGFGGMALVDGLRWSLRGKDAGSADSQSYRRD